MAAKNQIEQMLAEDELARNRAEVTAAAMKRKAEREVKQGDGGASREAALKAEENRLRVGIAFNFYFFGAHVQRP